MSATSKDNLIQRAIAAWHREQSQGEKGLGFPSADSAVRTLKGHQYVILRSATGILAIYRVRNTGFLRRMRRPPAALLSD